MIIKCSACEHDVSDKAIRCNKCGNPISGNENSVATKSKSSATLSYLVMAIALIIGFIMSVKELQHYNDLYAQLDYIAQIYEAQMNMLNNLMTGAGF